MNEKPKYSIFQNVVWMIKNAWLNCKSVLVLCIISAILAVGINLAQLFIPPVILDKVEQSVPLRELLFFIIFFAVLLFLLLGLKAYVGENTTFGRIDVRIAILKDVSYKTNVTSYPNTLDKDIVNLRSKAKEALNDNTSACEHIWETLTKIVTNMVGFAVYMTLLTGLSPVLVAVVVFTSVISFFVTKKANEWRYIHKEEEETYLKQIGYVRRQSESITLAKDIRIFGLQDWLSDVHFGVLNLYESFIAKSEKIALLGNAAEVMLSIARNGIAYVYLIYMALRQGMPASEFLLYFTAVSGFTAWITGILHEMLNLHKESLDINYVRAYLELEEPFLFEGGKPVPKVDKYELTMENVSFRYPEGEKDIIHKMNITIQPGEKLAIVGLNGAGKTTLVKLLCGLFDPTEGRVLLNGQDIREFNRREYYELFAAVFQKFSVLEATIAENVSQTDEDVDMERVRNCLEKAGLDEKIAQFPKGLETYIGRKVYENGVLLSGGQMQRMMLARALYKNGSILVLDEPTAALDPIAENDIYMKYSEMTAGKTSVFISHRLASTRFCDRIIFLENGQIMEEGTHEELLKAGGGYAELFEVQSRYYQEGRAF